MNESANHIDTRPSSQIYETVLLPLMHPELISAANAGDGNYSDLLEAPRGCLFYGAPGTGKTLMAKCIARDSGAAFINLQPSSFENKWLGESQKIVRAVFSLAQKLAPTIIFVDEIDMVLPKRGSSEAYSSISAQFMLLWEGLSTQNDKSVLVLGATNRPFDLDPAVLRRLPAKFLFDLPG